MAGLLVHEWIERSGGAERVLDAMASAFPDAGIQCLWNDAPERYADRTVHETWLARTPLRRHKALALPFTVPTWRRLNPKTPYDWMLIGSYVFSHHARLISSDVPKYVYAHTPARYIWSPELDDRGRSATVRAVAPIFRRIDRLRAEEPVAIAANSAFVRDRIRRAWDRDAIIINPPVSVKRITATNDWREKVVDAREKRIIDALPATYVMGASRFVPYKGLDLVIAAAARAGLPALIAGSGPDEARLRRLAESAGVPVTFAISPSDALLYTLMQRSSAFVFPAVEDFGIVPVEAQAAGTPVVTGPVGGQLETFDDGVSGVVAASTDPADLARAISGAMALPSFNAIDAVAPFSESVFADKIKNFVRA